VTEPVKTGWERRKRVHFDEIVEKYDKVRPGFPAALFEDIFKYNAPGNGRKALEIGAGTGKATAPFLTAGYDVSAVEIGVNMTEFLRERFKEYKNFDVINAAFEDASLEKGGYDLVYAACAFHWVDAEIGCPKVFNLLKNNGVFALFRHSALPANGEELYEAVQAVYEKHYYTYYKTQTRPVRIPIGEFYKAGEVKRGFGFEDLRIYGFQDVKMKLYEETRTFGADEYITYLDTNSDHRSLPEENRVALYAGVEEAITKHGGRFTVDYVFQLYMGRRI